MGKFLSGAGYDGTLVPLCTYWRGDVETDTSRDIAPLESSRSGAEQCIANHYFPRDDITCFNSGSCNGEGKCITCSKYKYGGTRLGISHSPPVDILRFFNKGLSDSDIKSPNLVRFPPQIVQQVDHDQMPLHILIRNVQAEVAKCCNWSMGDGTASRFFLAVVRNGPDTVTVTQANGQLVTLRGLRVTHSVFDNDEGVFLPVGITVVAGFEDAPSFYLEPRTGLIKPGEDVIFNFNADSNDISSATHRAKSAAAATSQVVIDAVNATTQGCNSARTRFSQSSSFLNNAINTGNAQQIATAQAKAEELSSAQTAACEAALDAPSVGQEAINNINAVVEASTKAGTISAAAELVITLEELLVLVVIASIHAGDTSARTVLEQSQNRLSASIRELNYSGTGAFTKCEFFITNENIAAPWNSPEDGTLPCNGVRTDCPFYTGKEWLFATEERMSPGQNILAEAIQEVRYRSDDWSRFSDPAQEFRNRFALPFLWAFKGYVPVGGQPEVENMLLYRPKVLYGRDTGEDQWETMAIERVAVSNFDGDGAFEVTKNVSRTTPGSKDRDQERSTDYPSLIDSFTVPTNTRLKVTHPKTTSDALFTYRTWSPDKNTITLMGTATPGATIRIVNETALRNRQRYHAQFGTVDFANIPSTLPGLPTFNNIAATLLEEQVFDPLRLEKSANVKQRGVTPLGFDEVAVQQSGFWISINEVELVHNTINDIYVILIAGPVLIFSEKIQIDYRFMHAIVTQTSFDGLDFTMVDSLSSQGTGILTTDVIGEATVRATTRSLVSSRESPKFNYGYYGLRFKNRNLRFGTQSADNDLRSSNPLLGLTGSLLVEEAGPSTFISAVGYQVVQYRKKITIDEWYVVNDCGLIMLVFDDTELHRVLPLPNQQGENPPLKSVLVNDGGLGSVVAQWAIEKAEISVAGLSGTRPLVQFYRDPDGVGLPANYVLVGPDHDVVNSFGRPEFGRDTISVTVTFLRPQSTRSLNEGGDAESDPELSSEVLTSNFHKDTLRGYRHTISFDDSGALTAGGSRTYEGTSEQAPIVDDQQDYCYVFSDSTGRPIGRKYTRFLLNYYNIACLNVEIFYAWTTDCEIAALIPDLFLAVGSSSGQTSSSVSATTDPNDPRLILGSRVKNLLGSRDCRRVPSCGDHEFLSLGSPLREFEVIANVPAGTCDGGGTFEVGEEGDTTQKAIYVSAGQQISGEVVSTRAPGTPFRIRQGPLWDPHIACERPRYRFVTNGPLNTDSTELINDEGTPPGVSGASFSASEASDAGPGCFEGLSLQSSEAYHAVDRITPKILDIHPSLRACTSAYTYGNQIIRGGESKFTGYARVRGEIDLSWYESIPGWEIPPFSNIGRAKIFSEVTSKRGDYLGGPGGKSLGFRWMPMFPEREDLGSSSTLFGEDMEPQSYRLLCVSTPIGDIGESVPASPLRYTQKSLIHNRVGGGIEYPYVPYYPSFLPDSSLGTEPRDRSVEGLEGGDVGPITTMWAWREQESFIKRARQSSSLLAGVQLDLPAYFIDNRRMEVRLRPEEGNHTLAWTPPTFTADGSLDRPAELKLGLDGPPRQIDIDFKTRKFGLTFQPNTVYDTTKSLISAPFPCEDGTPTDNLRMGATCSCIEDISSEELSVQKLPSRLLHLDELAPDGFFSLYENTVLNTPFAIDLSTTQPDRPRNLCIYYIRGIFFRINADFIPSVLIPDASFDNRVSFTYTWSRVPHGYTSGQGIDGTTWGAAENRADGFVNHSAGSVFQNRFNTNVSDIDIRNDDPAVFPSVAHANNQILLGAPIAVRDLAPGDARLKGGRPALGGQSRGETERIILTVDFPTYVRIDQVNVDFIAGVGWEAPKYQLVRVEPSQIGQGTYPSSEVGQTLGTSTQSAIGSDIPGSDSQDSDFIREGRYRFSSAISPVYGSQPFWNQFGKRFHLVFEARGNAQSMGVAGISFKVGALVSGAGNTEIIEIPERKYYRSSGTVPGNINPEQVLGSVDSATAYWQTVDTRSQRGANRHRAYAWGSKLDDSFSRPITSSAIQDLERLQFSEYDTARNLMGSTPYVFQYRSFIPFDEQEWLRFLNEPDPSWQCRLSVQASNLDVLLDSGGDLKWDTVPFRAPFNPPGHAWTWGMSDESYDACCEDCPKQQLISFKYLHLHDGLAVIETARFWDELPSGFSRLMRSTLGAPDPRFGQSNESGEAGAVLLDARLFTDAQGNPIPTSILENAGFAKNDEGGFVIVDRGST